MTNPSRAPSIGRDGMLRVVVVAVAERPDDVERAERERATAGTSTPPAIAASISPSRIALSASPSATAPLAHELAVDRIGPRTSSAMPRLAGAAPPNTASARVGETDLRPRSRYFSCWISANAMPPSADPR